MKFYIHTYIYTFLYIILSIDIGFSHSVNIKCKSVGEHNGQESLDKTVGYVSKALDVTHCRNYKKNPHDFYHDLYNLKDKSSQVILDQKSKCACIKDQLKTPLSSLEKKQIKEFVNDEYGRIEVMNITSNLFKVMKIDYLHGNDIGSGNRCGSIKSLVSQLEKNYTSLNPTDCSPEILGGMVSIVGKTLGECKTKDSCSKDKILKLYSKAMSKSINELKKDENDQIKDNADMNNLISLNFSKIIEKHIVDGQNISKEEIDELLRTFDGSDEFSDYLGDTNRRNEVINLFNELKNDYSLSGKSIKEKMVMKLFEFSSFEYPLCIDVISEIENTCSKYKDQLDSEVIVSRCCLKNINNKRLLSTYYS